MSSVQPNNGPGSGHQSIDAENIVVGTPIGVGYGEKVGVPIELDGPLAGSPVVVIGEAPPLEQLANVDASSVSVDVPQSWVLSSADGVWRPVDASTVSPSDLAFAFVQSQPSLTWLIMHTLSFEPAAIEVRSSDDGHILYPKAVVRSAGTNRIRLDFTRPVSGTAKLS